MGRTKLARMAAMAIEECLEGVARTTWASIPLLLCVAEKDRPGRTDGLDDRLLHEIESELRSQFGPQSLVIAQGRVGVLVALNEARTLILSGSAELVLISATDSLVAWRALSAYADSDRLLTVENSNGFLPGEAAGALLVNKGRDEDEAVCEGIGFGKERSHVGSTEPLRADGLRAAVSEALLDAGCQLHEVDFRISDLSGEQYYFKEAALLIGRLLRHHKESFDLWHPAECIGECGAAVGATMLALARAACKWAPPNERRVLLTASNDDGMRAAAVLTLKRR